MNKYWLKFSVESYMNLQAQYMKLYDEHNELKQKIKERIKILEDINDNLKFVENRGYEPENYIINSNKYIINFLNKLLNEGGKDV